MAALATGDPGVQPAGLLQRRAPAQQANTKFGSSLALTPAHTPHGVLKTDALLGTQHQQADAEAAQLQKSVVWCALY